MTELKPCPFCNEDGYLIKQRFSDYLGKHRRTYWQVRHRCKFGNYLETKFCGTKTEAARYWNRRAE